MRTKNKFTRSPHWPQEKRPGTETETETETRDIKSRLVVVLHLNDRVSTSQCKTKIIPDNSRDSIENQIITRNAVIR